MESSGGSSFIPQRPTKGKVAAKSFRKVYVLSYVSYLVFFSTLLAVAGIFLYQLSLQSSLNNLQQELIAQKNLFNQSDLDRVQSLDRRLDAASELVNNHVSIVRVLGTLETVIAQPVQFLNFNYDRIEDPQRPKLALSAMAKEFNEVIFQDRIMESHGITRPFTVTSVNLATQAIDPEQLQLGVEQVVNVNMAADLEVSEIIYTGTGTTFSGNEQTNPADTNNETEAEATDTTDSSEPTATDSTTEDATDAPAEESGNDGGGL